MYNRYINSGGFDDLLTPPPGAASGPSPPEPETPVPVFADVPAAEEPPPQAPAKPPSKLGALKGLFGGNIKLPDFDADTILLIVLVYFLVADENENISDTLLIIGVLMLLGF